MTSTLQRAVELFGISNVAYFIRQGTNEKRISQVEGYLDERELPPVEFLEKVVQAVLVFDTAVKWLGSKGEAQRFMFKAVNELGGGPYEAVDAGEYMELRAYMNKHRDDLLRGDR